MTDSVLTEEIVVNNINYIREPKGMFDAYLAFLRNFGYPKAGVLVSLQFIMRW